MRRVFSVEPSNGKDLYGELELPASTYQLLDMLERLNMKSGDLPEWEICEYHCFEFLAPFLDSEINLYELNALCQKLGELDGLQSAALDGLLQMEVNKREGPIGIDTALVDCDDIHCLMIGASGVGKTAFFLYPNMEYACASGMSYLALDTKGDLARNYGAVASKHYGYRVAVIDLRNPTRSDGYNLLTLINRYMDICQEQPNNLAARAKAEKYAKILAKTIVNPEGDASNYGQNAFFYDAAEGLLTAVILLLAEYLPPTEEDPKERRHIVSVFKLVQDLLAPGKSAMGGGMAQGQSRRPRREQHTIPANLRTE